MNDVPRTSLEDENYFLCWPTEAPPLNFTYNIMRRTPARKHIYWEDGVTTITGLVILPGDVHLQDWLHIGTSPIPRVYRAAHLRYWRARRAIEKARP